MKVNFVDPLCDKLLFTNFENSLVRADVGSNKLVSKTLGHFLDQADSYGGRTFSVIGKCLSLADRDDSIILISLNASDDGECQTPGIYQGSLIINFDRFSNGQSIISFNIALDCNPGFELVGSDGSDHNYILGGPELFINLGTWKTKSNFGSLIQQKLKQLYQTHQDWLKVDKIFNQLPVFGHPQNFQEDYFEFIFQALHDDEVIASSVININFAKLKSKVVEPTLTAKNMLSLPPLLKVKARSDEQDLVEQVARRPSIKRKLGAKPLCDCSQVIMIRPTLPDVSINPLYVSTTIPAFSNQNPKRPCPATPLLNCGARTCTSNHPNVIWDNASQLFTVQSLGQVDVAGTKWAQLTCFLTDWISVKSSSAWFKLTITKQSCANGNAMTVPTLPALTINQSYASTTTIAAFGDTTSASTNPLTCGFRNCWISGSPIGTNGISNVIWDYTTQKFTVQSLGSSNVAGTYSVTLTCRLKSYQTVPSASQTFQLTIVLTTSCDNGNVMIMPTLPDVNIDQYYTTTTIPAFGDTFSGSANPLTCLARTCNSDHPNVIWSNQSQIFSVQSLAPLADVAGTYTVKLTCSLTSYTTMLSASSNFQLTVMAQCTLTSIVADTSPEIQGQITQIIFDTAKLYQVSTYTQNPECGFTPSYTVQAATQNLPYVGPLQPSPLFWVLDATNMQIQLQSNDPSLAGITHQVELVVTIGSLTDKQSLIVTWENPCATTTFIASPIDNSFGFINSPAITVKVRVPWLNDQANIDYGGSTNPSICSTQSFVITENGLTPPYLTTSFDAASGQDVINFATTNTLMAGPHLIAVEYSLVQYPTVTNTATFTFVFYELLVPIPPATTTYQVSSPTLSILMNSYQASPVNPAIVITNSASLASGGVLPGFIVFSEISSGISLKFALNTANNLSVGTYQILVTTTFSLLPQPVITRTQNFTLKVTPSAASQNFAPTITSGYEPEVTMLWNSTKVIDFVIDDLEKDAVKVNVDFGSLQIYCSFTSSDTKIHITCGPLEFQPAQSLSDTIIITLKDDITPVNGATLPQNQYKIPLQIKIEDAQTIDSKQVQFTAAVVAFSGTKAPVQKKNNSEIPTVALPLLRPQIKIITNMALVNVTFNGNISANITREQIKVRYIQNSNEIDQMATFKWNIAQVNTTFMLIQLNFTQPILVSQGRIPDMLEVYYRNDYLYPIGKIAPFLDLNFTSDTQIMPKLAPSQKTAQTINAISSLTADLASSSFWMFIAIYLVLSTAMKYVWATFNTLQIILVLPMLMVNVPVNVSNVQDSFKKIVNLEFVDKQKVYQVICEPLFGEIIETIKSPHAEISADLLAERSKSLVIQITLMVVFCVVVVAVMIGLIVLRTCIFKVKNKTVLNVYKQLEAKVMFSSVLRYAIQQYMAFSLTALIAINKNLDKSQVQDRLLVATATLAEQPDIKQIVITSLLTLFLIFYPAFCYWFLRRYAIILYMQVMKMRYGTLYVGLNYYKKSSHVYLTIFLVRRLLFAVIVVNVTQNVELQLILSLYCSMMMLYYLMAYMPMWDLALNVIFLFNEACLFVCTSMMFLFTDYVPSPEDRFTLGWAYLGVLGFNVLGNVVYVAYDVVLMVQLKLYYKKVIKELVAFREARKVKIELMKIQQQKYEEARSKKMALERKREEEAKEDLERLKKQEVRAQILDQERQKLNETQAKIMELEGNRIRHETFERNLREAAARDAEQYMQSIEQETANQSKIMSLTVNNQFQKKLEEKIQRDLEEYKTHLRLLFKNTIPQNDSKLLQSMVEQEWDGIYVAGERERIFMSNKVQDSRQQISTAMKLEMNEVAMELQMQKNFKARRKLITTYLEN